jgi:NAD(P)H-dependent FMN reductase
MRTYKVGYFVGSLSSTSINRELSKALIRLAPEDLEFTEISIGNLPLYSQDYDANFPPEATALKDAIHQSDAILFVTPEYNRSIPGALKNAIWVFGSRGRSGRCFPGRRSRRPALTLNAIDAAVAIQHPEDAVP